RQRLWARLFGDIFLLLPFCLIIAWYGWGFAQVAWNTNEGSTQGGLQSRWIIKAMLPLSFAMLAAFGVIRAVGTAIQLARGNHDEDEDEE
ncbi:MAG: TRAP transporter small permease subunit, partial [Paracoccus sp. (in: a-proteobacteria)]|nr:TRAP transporter small permease subunit [Paracoccus sp. (in: a-proteobacteria)]